MARRWVVLTADRDPHDQNEIIAYTEWDGHLARADEVIYTDPVDADGAAVDGAWKVSGSVTRAGAGTAADPYVYTYADSGLEPSLIDRQRGQIFDAYLHWRIFGRTDHWRGIRSHRANAATQRSPLNALDKWALHIVALIDLAINGVFPITGPLPPAPLQALIDHADDILRRLGPAWYIQQLRLDPPDEIGEPTAEAVLYADLATEDGTAIYTDVCTALAVPRTIDGEHLPMAVNIRAGFDPESRNLGN